MAFAAEMIISPTKKMVEATYEMVDLTEIEVLMTEMIFSAVKKIMSAAEATFAVADTMVFVTQIIIAEATKMLPAAGKMLFVPPTVLCARQPVRVQARRNFSSVKSLGNVENFLRRFRGFEALKEVIWRRRADSNRCIKVLQTSPLATWVRRR
jgi:hypothetical protein